MVTENKRFTRLFSEEQPTIRPRDNRAAEKVKTLVTREKHVPNKILSLSISWLLVRRLGRAKKRRDTGGGDEGPVQILSEQQTNRGSRHRRIRTCHSRCAGTRMQSFQQGSMDGVRGFAPGPPGSVAICSGVSL